MQGGEVEVCEWTNYALACRFQAAAMGVSFLPMRSMLGTDTFDRSAAAEIECPFTGQKAAAVPALAPDVSVIHVHESDCFGNCRIYGITMADAVLARASKRVIITTERIVSTDEIRERPYDTVIPSFCVDSVCEVPSGSYPGNMPGAYFSDEDHLKAWMIAEEDETAFDSFLTKYLYDVSDFSEYIDLCGGEARIAELRAEELEPGRA